LARVVSGEVDRRRLDRRVPEKPAHIGDVRAVLQQLRRAGMAQGVGMAQVVRQLGERADRLEDLAEHSLAAARARALVAAVAATPPDRDEQRIGVLRGAEGAGALAVLVS
jgi:hypothetical protein